MYAYEKYYDHYIVKKDDKILFHVDSESQAKEELKLLMGGTSKKSEQNKVRYNNYHKHDHISNIFTPDTNSKMIDYVNRAIELGEPNVWTTNHGSGGDIFEARSLCDDNNLHCKFGMEGYIVPNPLEKDARNYHIILIPTTNKARKKLNLASSRANIEGYYYKPRLFLEDLLNFDKNELYITTACVAGLLKDEDSYNELFMPLYEHFEDNLFVEVQSHNEDIQKSVNERAIWCRDNLGLKLIHANDSHYIYPYQSNERLELLKGKGINYGEEDSFVLDYPTFEEIVDRYKTQGILNENDINEALETTLLLDDVEDILIDKTIKMPTIYPNLNEEEKYQVLVDEVFEGFTKIMKEDDVDEDKQKQYIEECKKELQVIYDTKDVCHTPDYFLLNTKVIKKAIEYGGILTRTGRGSCGSFLLNKMLGITQIDRLTTNLPMYSDRFMSTARLLENRAMPDIDFNIVAQEPFVKATRDLLGENGCYPMIAYGTMKESEAFRNVCRSHNLEYDLYNEVGKNLDSYRDDEYWKPFIDEANIYVGTIISASVHPCSHILLNGDIREEIGVYRIGDAICAMITSTEADDWKYLKNDYLIVSVWDIISQTYKMIDQPIKTIKQLINSLDDDVWRLFDLGMTCTLNQTDGDWATKLLKDFKPRTVEEMAMFVGAIRPNFASLRDDFIARRPHMNGSKYLDELFANTYNRILFQENIMRYFEWLGVAPSLSIGLIKKISKKKIKQEDFDKLENGMKEQWKINTGTYDGFDETWKDMQSQISYGFNCVSGDTKIYRPYKGQHDSSITIEEMYKIKNDPNYAKTSGHRPLHDKYKHNGFGKTFSIHEDCKLYENNIYDIVYNGKADLYRVTLENGSHIDCTMNHRFPTWDGNKMLKDIKVGDTLFFLGNRIVPKFNYNLGGENNLPKKGQQGFQTILNPTGKKAFDIKRQYCVDNALSCERCGCEYTNEGSFELHHKDMNRKNNSDENLMWLCNSCHKLIHYTNPNRTKRGDIPREALEYKIISIEYVGNKDVYDVQMDGDYHTWVANDGIVTHNSPHGLATALDCLYGAELKAHHPLEYYTVALNIYKNDTEKTSRLINEMKYFGIKLAPVKFRYSNDNYNMNKETNTIYKSVSSIKDMGKHSGEELYSLKDEIIATPYQLLRLLKERTSINSKQLDILVKIGFFNEFGEPNRLLKIIEYYNRFANAKVISKNKLEEWQYDIVEKHAGKKTDKQYRDIDNNELLIEDLWSNDPKLYRTTNLQIAAWEIKYLNTAEIKDNVCDDNIYIVEKVNVTSFGTVYLSLYNPRNSFTEEYKCNKASYKDMVVEAGDIIKVILRTRKKRIKVDEEWVESEEQELYIKDYVVLQEGAWPYD